MNRNDQHILKEVTSAWNDVIAGIRKMYQGIDVKPVDAVRVFQLEDGGNGQTKFQVGPIIFRMPEKASSRDVSLYIAVSGWLTFCGLEAKDKRIKTANFSTQVGYFRVKNGTLKHVYGAHYDLDEYAPGHPIFHGQMSPQMDFITDISDLFRLDIKPENSENYVSPVLSNVRIPTAQMDVFSVITQICADHLICADSRSEVRDAFASLRKACSFFVGAANRFPFLCSEPASNCYRSTHWYAAPAPTPVVAATE